MTDTAPIPVTDPEVVLVAGHRIACDGDGGALGHPRVYLEMGADPFVECPYCDRRFVMAGAGAEAQSVPGVYEDSHGH